MFGHKENSSQIRGDDTPDAGGNSDSIKLKKFTSLSCSGGYNCQQRRTVSGCSSPGYPRPSPNSDLESPLRISLRSSWQNTKVCGASSPSFKLGTLCKKDCAKVHPLFKLMNVRQVFRVRRNCWQRQSLLRLAASFPSTAALLLRGH